MKYRREKIRKYIISKGFVTLSELSALFPAVSMMTLRRDLDFLEGEGDVVRTKGGAKSIRHLSMQKEEAYNRREFINSELKEEIAAKVVSMLENNSCVFFDSGSTLMHIVKALGEKPVFAVTNGPNIALELVKNPNCEINVLCGTLNRDNISLSGLNAEKFVEGINIGTAVVAASGYSYDCGFTCGSYSECQLKRAVISRAARVIMVMDSTKFGRSHPFTFAELGDIDILVSDSSLDEEMRQELERANAKIV